MQTICKTEICLNRWFHVKNASLTSCVGHIEAAVITLKAEGRLLFASLPYCSVNMTVIRTQAERGLEGTARTSWLSSPAALVDSCRRSDRGGGKAMKARWFLNRLVHKCAVNSPQREFVHSVCASKQQL